MYLKIEFDGDCRVTAISLGNLARSQNAKVHWAATPQGGFLTIPLIRNKLWLQTAAMRLVIALTADGMSSLREALPGTPGKEAPAKIHALVTTEKDKYAPFAAYIDKAFADFFEAMAQF